MKDALEKEICIWGAGLVGYSLAVHLAEHGRNSLLMDICKDRAARVNAGQMPFEHAVEFLSPPTGMTGSIRACVSAACALTEAHAVHFICVPTEIAGRICSAALTDVVQKIASQPLRSTPVFVLIESTVSPIWLESIVHGTFQGAGWTHGVHYHVGCSPRRDVFGQRGHTLANTAKVYGGDSEECNELLRAIYSPICGQLHQARDAKHAVLTKIVENLFRYRDIMLANELAHLLPDVDLVEVMGLAATKWNMGHFHPSLGIGGYCVPLAKEYLAESIGEKERAILRHASAYELDFALSSMERIYEQCRPRSVAVLGLSYAPGLKVHTLSPTFRLIEFLRARGCEVKVHDPYYTPEEIRRVADVEPLDFPEGLHSADTVILMTAHPVYTQMDPTQLDPHFAPNSFVVDNTCTWLKRSFPATLQYVPIGGTTRHV